MERSLLPSFSEVILSTPLKISPTSRASRARRRRVNMYELFVALREQLTCVGPSIRQLAVSERSVRDADDARIGTARETQATHLVEVPTRDALADRAGHVVRTHPIWQAAHLTNLPA